MDDLGSQSDYSELALDHLRNPRNAGELEGADGMAYREHPACGDRLRIWVGLTGEQITRIGFRADGCAGTLAAASVATDLAKGLDRTTVLRDLTPEAIERDLGGLPVGKRHCSSLAAEVLLAAVRDAEGGRTPERLTDASTRKEPHES